MEKIEIEGKKPSNLEKKIKWAKGGMTAFAVATVFGVGCTFYPLTHEFPDRPPSAERHTLTKRIIEKIDQDKKLLTEAIYFVGDTLLNKFNEQQLELDSLTKARFEKYLTRIEKEPEFIKYDAQLNKFTKKQSKKIVYRGIASGILALGGLVSAIVHEALKYKKRKSEVKN